MTVFADTGARARPRRSRAVLGILLSAYGLYAVVQWSRAVRSSLPAIAGSALRTVGWWPVAPPWLSALDNDLRSGVYIVCCAALLICGVGVVFGHRLSTRITMVALATLIGLWLVGLPFDIGLTCGWVTFDFGKISATALHEAAHVPPEVLRNLRPEVVRVGAALGMVFSALKTLLIAGALVWLRREAARDASASGDVREGG